MGIVRAAELSSELGGPVRIAVATSPSNFTGTTSPPSKISSARGVSAKHVNVPCEPRRSGTHIPDSRTPLNFSGGKVIGTRSTVLNTPCSPRMFQNGTLLRSSFMTARPFESRRIADDESSGRYDCRFRFRKSKMLCLPGFVPVMNDDHAAGEIGGQLDSMRL